MSQLSWLAEAWRELGQRELAGPADNARIMRMYRDAGHPGVAHDEVPWCAAFVGACLERAGIRSSRSLMARSYTKWGTPAGSARFGAIAVFSRGSDPALGHVGFALGETAESIMLLGGNQGNAVTVVPVPKSRLLALRWPTANPLTGAAEPIAPPEAAPSSEVPSSGGYEPALVHVLEMEGGYTDDPYDPGGPTNKGILLREYAKWIGVTLNATNTARLKAELKAIPDATVAAIYRKNYWLAAGCDRLPPALALMHFDAAVNHGLGSATRMLQQAVGVEADGQAGPITRAAITQAPVRKTVTAYADIRRRRYRALHHFWRFGRGWLRRVDKTLGRSLELIGTAAPEYEPAPLEQGDTSMAKQTVQPQPQAEPQPQAKWWGSSMTLWGVFITALSSVVPALAPVIGVEIPGDLVRDTGGQIVTTLQGLGGLFGSLLAIYGRFRANQPLARRELSVRL